MKSIGICKRAPSPSSRWRARKASGQREHLKNLPRRTLASLGGAATGEGWEGGYSSMQHATSQVPPTRRPLAADLPRKGGGEEKGADA